MDISISQENDAVIITIDGRLNAVSAPELETELEGVESPNVILDMSALEYISSAGLRTLLVAAKRLRQDDGDLLLAGVQDKVMNILEVSGFDSMLAVHDSVEEAKTAVSG